MDADTAGQFLPGQPEVIGPIKSNKGGPSSTRNIKLDESWAKNTLMVPSGEMTVPTDVRNRSVSSANFKYTDTTLGGNIATNVRPQYTRYADIRNKGRVDKRNPVGLADVNGNYGMGRAYSEYIDDATNPVFMRLGVAEFNSIGSFLTTFSNPKLVKLATTGRSSGGLGAIVGKGAFYLASYVIAGPVIMGMLGVMEITGIALDAIRKETSKFYHIKPMMPLYWSAVTTITNTLLINEGPYQLDDSVKEGEENRDQMDKNVMEHLNKVLPDVFTSQGGIDVPSVISRSLRIHNKIGKKAAAADKSGTPEGWLDDNVGKIPGDVSDIVAEVKKGQDKKSHSTFESADGYARSPHYRTSRNISPDEGSRTSESEAESFYEYAVRKLVGESEFRGAMVKVAEDAVDTVVEGIKSAKPSDIDNPLMEAAKAEMSEGTAFATLNVDHVEMGNYSFNNSVKDSAIGDKYNTASSTTRDVRFDLAGGNIGDGTVANAIESVTGFLSDVRSGVATSADSITLGLTGALDDMINGANTVIPKHWDSSTATLPTATFTIPCVAPYNNFYSRTQNIYIPVSMWLSTMLPLQTGTQSYTSPLYLQLWKRGKFRIPLGMNTSLTLSPMALGTSEDRLGRPMGLEIKVTITDLSPIMPLTIGATWAGSTSEVARSLSRDNSMSDILNVLSGTGHAIDIYKMPQLKRRARALQQGFGVSWSSASMAMYANHDIASGKAGWFLQKIHQVVDLNTSVSNTITR